MRCLSAQSDWIKGLYYLKAIAGGMLGWSFIYTYAQLGLGQVSCNNVSHYMHPLTQLLSIDVNTCAHLRALLVMMSLLCALHH